MTVLLMLVYKMGKQGAAAAADLAVRDGADAVQ